MNRLNQIWLALKESLWFIPIVMVACSIFLALIFIELGGLVDSDFQSNYPRIFGAGADGSRGMLSAIAGSMITVAGLTFSLTVVAMAQASGQYTSRILRNFMRDRRNQFVLGFFVGVFAYCLVVLRTIRGGDEGMFIPSLAVLFGLGLAISSIGVLIFFIHHIASSIQASVIIKTAADETIAAVERLFPEELAEEADEREREQFGDEIERAEWGVVTAARNGYVQSVNQAGLIRFTEKHGCILKMEAGIGEFVHSGAPLASYTNNLRIDEDAKRELQNLYSVGAHRTIEKDAGFGIRQLVDIALKALSPGVNDTTTALICVDYLTAILVELGKRNLESLYRSKDGKMRVIAKGATYDSLVSEAFDQIRDSASNNTAVYLRLVAAIQAIARQASKRSRLAVLQTQLNLIAEEAARTIKSEYNLDRVREKIAETKDMVGKKIFD